MRYKFIQKMKANSEVVMPQQEVRNPNITPFKQFVVFTLTFMCYVGLHAIRAAWAYSKSILATTYQYPQWINGAVDVAYLLSYSLGMATIGTMTNKFRLNLFLGFGMIFAALFFSSFAFVDAVWGTFLVPVMFVGMALNGFSQSTGWPGMMATMGNWFGKGRRGLLLAFWSVNANVGNIVGSVVCSNLHENWKLNVFVTSIIAASIGVVIILLLQPAPKPSSIVEDSIKQSLVESNSGARAAAQPTTEPDGPRRESF